MSAASDAGIVVDPSGKLEPSGRAFLGAMVDELARGGFIAGVAVVEPTEEEADELAGEALLRDLVLAQRTLLSAREPLNDPPAPGIWPGSHPYEFDWQRLALLGFTSREMAMYVQEFLLVAEHAIRSDVSDETIVASLRVIGGNAAKHVREVA